MGDLWYCNRCDARSPDSASVCWRCGTDRGKGLSSERLLVVVAVILATAILAVIVLAASLGWFPFG